MSLTIRDLYNDGMALLGIYNPDYAPQTARDHVLNDITAALQIMQLAGEDFYAREELELGLLPGIDAYDLPERVQQILEPARLAGGRSLMGLRTRSELDNFGSVFLGSYDQIPNGSPLAYFVETLRDDAGADATQIKLHVTPAPAESDQIMLNVINDPPLYTAADLCGNSPTPPVPHKYHESILQPIVRMNVTTCDLYARNRAGFPMIEQGYLKALTLLGLADPRPGNPDTVSNELKAQAQPKAAQ
jgi:hypothetical protein